MEKGPDSHPNQLKPIQSERNLTHVSQEAVKTARKSSTNQQGEEQKETCDSETQQGTFGQLVRVAVA
jgi:hypothetical protein